MTSNSKQDFEIFLVTAPGLEPLLAAEIHEKGFKNPTLDKGGVTVKGAWHDVWRANLEIRGAARILVRIGSFRAFHLAQLDKRSRRFPWHEFLKPEVPVRIEVACKRSKIYHAGAARQRIAKAIKEELGAPVSQDAPVTLKARILDDLCTFSIDTSGEGLHKRGHKQAVNKAPMRETLASLFLRFCGYNGEEPVIDPMCGSGTFVIEAAEIAGGLFPGRSRHFAFEHLKTFDQEAWATLKAHDAPPPGPVQFFGYDRDAGAVEMSKANAKRAGLQDITRFQQGPISDLSPPIETPGLIIINPPYGGRIGNTKKLAGLYHALGETLLTRFPGWRVGLITNVDSLAKKTGLPFIKESPIIDHGGIGIKIYSTGPLGQ